MISKTYTLYGEYLYIYVDISGAVCQHIHTRTQNEWHHIRHHRVWAQPPWETEAEGRLPAFSFSRSVLSEKVLRCQYLCTDFVIMPWWYVKGKYLKYFDCNIYSPLIVLKLRDTFIWKLSSNPLAISEVFKTMNTRPEAGSSQPGVAVPGPPPLFWGVWLYVRSLVNTRTCDSYSCGLRHTHCRGRVRLVCASIRVTAEAPKIHGINSSICPLDSWAGFRWSRPPGTYWLPSQHRCLPEVSKHQRNEKGAPTWLRSPMQRGDSAPWHRLQVQNLHIKIWL